MLHMRTAAVVCLSVLCATCITVGHAESLYRPDAYRALTADPRAQGIGDVVTVLIVEAASAESSADSTEDAGFELSAGLTDASGLSRGGVSVDTGSVGSGRTARAGKLRAQVSARVDKVLDNGNLLIRGSQLITINGEQQRITVQGVVRPIDIAPDNTVLSGRMMDARIEYVGEGWVARNQRPGLFRRLLQFFGF